MAKTLNVPVGYDSVGVRHWEDIEYTAEAFRHQQYPDTHIEFRVYRMTGSELVIRGEVFPFGYDGGDGFSPIPNFREAHIYLAGSVKWDGCSNWQFVEQERVMLHFCGVESASNLGELFKRLYTWAKELGMDD